MRRTALIGVGLFWIVAGCAAGEALYPGVSLQPERYQIHNKVEHHAVIHWNLLRQGGQVVAEGYVEATGGRGTQIVVKEMVLTGADKEGRVINKSDGILPSPSVVEEGTPGVFRISLSPKGSETSFDLQIDYYTQTFPFRMGR
jgi:hypothetical protein